MSQAISIDNFIDAHSTNAGVVLCGKLGIAKAILEAEKKSKLYFDEQKGPIHKFDHNKIPGTWYLPFFQLLTENVRTEQIDTLFDNVTFITFNYDRCIEHYLYHALKNYYHIRDADAEKLMKQVKIYHPYGIVGCLQWQDLRYNMSFGGVLRDVNLVDIAGQIRTFSERMAGDDPTLAEIRRQVQEAETIVFLGFGFHELNMQLLSLETPSNVKRVVGTAMRISDTDVRGVVIESVVEMLKRRADTLTISINNQLTCCTLFDEYWRTLSRRL